MMIQHGSDKDNKCCDPCLKCGGVVRILFTTGFGAHHDLCHDCITDTLALRDLLGKVLQEDLGEHEQPSLEAQVAAAAGHHARHLGHHARRRLFLCGKLASPVEFPMNMNKI